ncbi:MAG: hypothetical protein K2J40_07655 [Ruminococcus sp.]|nr:hypothetical protein [Ruminococcus sp.]
MKKFISVLAAVMCVCVSCGDKNNSGNDSESDLQKETPAIEIITEVPEEISDRDRGYNEIISSYRKCMEESKLGNMMQLAYPDKYFEVFSFMAEISGMTVGEVMGAVSSSNANTIVITDIISDEPMEDYEALMDMLVDIYGEYQAISDYIEEQGGTEKVDKEKFNEFIDNAEYDSENITLYFSPQDVHLLKCNMESTVESLNGEGEPEITAYEQEFIVYYIDGEGWKMDIYSNVSE